MEISLSVSVRGVNFSGGAARTVPELFERYFKPLKTCDDPFVAIARDEYPYGGQKATRVRVGRRDLANILAEEISNIIVEQMKKNDTHNGYKIDESGK